MLIDLAVACAWIAMSAVAGAGLSVFGHPWAAGLAACADEQVASAHEDVYSLEPLSRAGKAWR